MNPEIHEIVEDMQKLKKKEPRNSSDILNYQIAQMARLLVLLASEAEKQSKAMTRLTWVIGFLTLALFFLAIIQLVMMS